MLPKDLTFEKALEELEEITQKLESGKESLEESMEYYERGILLKNFCEEKLKQAEGKWQVLVKGKDGSVKAKNLESDQVLESGGSQDTMFK